MMEKKARVICISNNGLVVCNVPINFKIGRKIRPTTSFFLYILF